MADYHVNIGNGIWLETESTGEKTIVFRTTYDKDGTCRSEEIVGWVYGEIESEEELREIAEERNLKAEYTL